MKRNKSVNRQNPDNKKIVLKEIKIDTETYLAFHSLMVVTGAPSHALPSLIEHMMHNILCLVMNENNDLEKNPLSFSEIIPIFQNMFPFSIFHDSSLPVTNIQHFPSSVESSSLH